MRQIKLTNASQCSRDRFDLLSNVNLSPEVGPGGQGGGSHFTFIDEQQHVFVISDNGCTKVFSKQNGAFAREVRRAAADAMSEVRPQ